MSQISKDSEEMNTEINENTDTAQRSLKHKSVIGLILVIALSVLSGLCADRYGADVTLRRNRIYEQQFAFHALGAVRETLAREEERRQAFYSHLYRSADLMSSMLRNITDEDGQYNGPETFEEGVVFHTEGSNVIWPDGFDSGTLTLPEGFQDANEPEVFYTKINTANETKDAAALIMRLLPDTWYLEWTSLLDENEFLDADVGKSGYLKAVEAVLDGWFILCDNNDPAHILYNGMNFDAAEIQKALRQAKNGSEEIEIENIHFYPFVREMEEENLTMLYLVSSPIIEKRSAAPGLVCGMMVFMMLGSVYIFLLSTEKMVFGHILTKPQTVRYTPRAVRRRTAAAGALCLLIACGLSLLLAEVDCLYQETFNASEQLTSYADAITAFNNREENLIGQEKEWLAYDASVAAGMLARYPQLINHAQLAAMNEALGSEYIMVFDENGEEMACSKDFIGFTLGEKESDPLYTFRRISKGLETVLAEPAQDFILDKTTCLFGQRLSLPETEGYGVLLISADPSLLNHAVQEGAETSIMYAASRQGGMILSFDEEIKHIECSSEDYMSGMSLEEAGFNSAPVTESNLFSFSLYSLDYYGISRYINGRLHYYAFERSLISANAPGFTLLCGTLCLLSFAILALYLLKGFTQENFEKYAIIGEEAVRDSSVEVITSDGRIKRSRDPSRRWALSFFSWKDLLPENKTRIAARTILSIYLIIFAACLYLGKDRIDSVTAYLMSGRWEKGFNLFALSSSLLILFSALLGLSLLSILTRLACSWLDTKGETILRLMFNLLQYAIMFTVLFHTFANFGIDTSALMTTMGLATLAVSIGARDLVADIIAGITIVFEGEYQVGDIVEIDGYRGKVQEIGVRSTKIMGMGDNIKIINNRDVRNVINTTRFNSWYALHLNIASSYDLKKVEEILEKELPEIRRKIRNCISGPIYKGVESIGNNSFRITILTECREEDYRSVQRQLNREIRLLFDKEGIPII